MFNKSSLRVVAIFCSLFPVFSLTGCQFMPHALQPSQLRKLNQGPELGRDTYNFSIPDPEIKEHKVDGVMAHDPFLSDNP